MTLSYFARPGIAVFAAARNFIIGLNASCAAGPVPYWTDYLQQTARKS